MLLRNIINQRKLGVAIAAIFWNMYAHGGIQEMHPRILHCNCIDREIHFRCFAASRFSMFSTLTGPNGACHYFFHRSFMRSRTHALRLVRLLLPILPANVCNTGRSFPRMYVLCSSVQFNALRLIAVDAT